eukprot:1160048-Pelagomonas_calceolata.AAC.13
MGIDCKQEKPHPPSEQYHMRIFPDEDISSSGASAASSRRPDISDEDIACLGPKTQFPHSKCKCPGSRTGLRTLWSKGRTRLDT